MKSLHSKHEPPITSVEGPPPSALDEHKFEAAIEEIGRNILHHCDRPEIETRILAFLAHAVGPTTDGIAREMGIPSHAAALHLQALSGMNRVWGQVVHGADMEWHISLEGRHFLKKIHSGENESSPPMTTPLEGVHLPEDEVKSERRSPEQHFQIAALAYSYFEEEGRLHGRSLEHWLRAERELAGKKEECP